MPPFSSHKSATVAIAMSIIPEKEGFRLNSCWCHTLIFVLKIRLLMSEFHVNFQLEISELSAIRVVSALMQVKVDQRIHQ